MYRLLVRVVSITTERQQKHNEHKRSIAKNSDLQRYRCFYLQDFFKTDKILSTANLQAPVGGVLRCTPPAS